MTTTMTTTMATTTASVVREEAPYSKNDAMPWVEKYRPSCFDEIVLDPMNRTILSNILETNYFPNLLFYGPPGTGKTTTIINLVNAYQSKLNMRNRGLMILSLIHI